MSFFYICLIFNEFIPYFILKRRYIEIAEFIRIQYYDTTARNEEEFSSNDDVLIKDG
jgi:hypothetical protein